MLNFKVKGIQTLKLELGDGQTLILHHSYVPKIQLNLIFVVVVLGLGISLNFNSGLICIYHGNIYYGCGHLRNNFMVLEYDRQVFNYCVKCFIVVDILGMLLWC